MCIARHRSRTRLKLQSLPLFSLSFLLAHWKTSLKFVAHECSSRRPCLHSTCLYLSVTISQPFHQNLWLLPSVAKSFPETIRGWSLCFGLPLLCWHCVLFAPLSASICTDKYYKHNVMKLIQHNGALPVKPASTNKEIVEGRSSRHGSRTVFLLSLPSVFSPSSRSQLCRKVRQVYNQTWPVFLQLLHSWYVVKFSVYSISKP